MNVISFMYAILSWSSIPLPNLPRTLQATLSASENGRLLMFAAKFMCEELLFFSLITSSIVRYCPCVVVCSVERADPKARTETAGVTGRSGGLNEVGVTGRAGGLQEAGVAGRAGNFGALG